MHRTRWILGVMALSLVFVGGSSSPADAEELTLERQGTMFKRIFAYDQLLRDTERIVVIMVSDDKEAKAALEVEKAFRHQGLWPTIKAVEELDDDLTASLGPRSSVIYVLPGVDHTTVKAFCERQGMLSISGLPTLAEDGHVSVSVDLVGEQPQILVNMERLKAERHELSAELLSLARVIR